MAEMPFCCPKKGAASQNDVVVSDGSPLVEEEVGSAQDFPPGTKKIVEVQGRKLLVVNDKGTLYCINGLCSHYNFPLETGFVSNGKIRCPLHGACFNLSNGDIEEYPGFDALNAYKIETRSGKLFVRASEKALSSDRRTRAPKKSTISKSSPLVVVGGGPAADSFVEHARLQGNAAPIVLLTADQHPPYDKVVLTKNLAVDINKIIHRSEQFYKEREITVRTNSRVVSIDATSRAVELENGQSIGFAKLVIAAGASPRRLTDPGSNLNNIFYIREHADIHGLYEKAKGKDVVVVGASFIGMEAAASIKSVAGSVTVLSATEEPMPAFQRDVGAAFREYFENKGVRIRQNVRVASFDGDSNGDVTQVKLQNGAVLPAQIVIAGIGVQPNTDFIRKAGNIKLDNRGFIIVDENFATNLPNIYAIGDICAFPLPYWNRKHVNVQHFQTAQKHGELLAYSLQQKPHPGPLVPFFWSIFFFEKGARFVGLADDYDEVYTRGDVSNFEFRKYYLKDNVVVAVCDSGRQVVAAIPFTEIFKKGIKVTRDEVEKNKTDDWSSYL